MKCLKCNNEIDSDSLFCEYCGAKIESKDLSYKVIKKNKVLLCLSLIFPIVGFCLFFVKGKEEGKMYLYSAILGFIVNYLIIIFCA